MPDRQKAGQETRQETEQKLEQESRRDGKEEPTALPTSYTPEGPKEAEFRVPASDQKGHSERLWLRIPPIMARQLEIVFAARAWPYKTSGDIVRHAILRHLAWLENQRPFPSVFRQVQLLNNLLRDEEIHEEFEAVMDRLEARVAKHLTTGRTDMAESLLNQAWDEVEQMPPGDWQEKYHTEIRRRFGHLMGSQ